MIDIEILKVLGRSLLADSLELIRIRLFLFLCSPRGFLTCKFVFEFKAPPDSCPAVGAKDRTVT